MRTHNIIWLSIAIVAVGIVFVATFVRAGSSDNVSGWAWSENIGC